LKTDKVNAKGETLLHQNCISGNLGKVRSLLAEGATVHTRDYCGWTPLHEACNHGYTEIAQLLLLNGAKVNDPGGCGCQGITPLHDAAINGHLEVLKLLIEFGADLSIQNAQGMTALDWVKDQIDSDDEDDNNSEDQIVNRRDVCDYLAKQMEVMHCGNDRTRVGLDGVCLGYTDSDDTSSPCSVQEHAARAEKDLRRQRNRPMTANHNVDNKSDSIELDKDLTNDSYPMEEHQDEDDIIQDSFKEKQETWSVSEPKRPCALIPESDSNNQERMTLDDWLIDDMGPAVKRARTSRKTTTQSISHHRQSDIAIDGQRNVITENHRSPVDNLSNHRQGAVGSGTSMMFNPPSTANVIAPKRVHVSVLGKTFVIPCPNPENDGSAQGLKIEWVASEAASRYYSMTGLRPRLLLKTQEGALFDPNDCVETVLANNEELQGYVEVWDLPRLPERYVQACSSSGKG
jgi:NF-kappa-B inhibitor-like protein 2